MLKTPGLENSPIRVNIHVTGIHYETTILRYVFLETNVCLWSNLNMEPLNQNEDKQ